MLVREFLELAYPLKKSGELSKNAIKFMEKHELQEDSNVSEQDLIILAQHLSSKEKRINIIKILLEKLDKQEVIVSKCNVGEWRTKSYKQVAKEVHPDSETGDTKSFQFLQEVKEYLWDFEGNPRKEFVKVKWSREKRIREGWIYEPTIKGWTKQGEKPIFSEDY